MLKPCRKWCPRTKEYKLEVDITNTIHEIQRHRFKYCGFIAEWTWASYLTYLNLILFVEY